MEEPARNADNAENAGIAENEKGSPPVERCLASSFVRLSRTMEDKCEAERREALKDLSLADC